MKTNKNIITAFLLIFIVFISTKVNAHEITSKSDIKLNSKKISTKVTDNSESTYITVSKNDEINIKNEENISSIYIIYEYSSKSGKITGNKKTMLIGENNFLHEFIDIKNKIGETNEIKIKFDEDVKIADIYLLGDGDLPSFVENWNKPYERADLLLFSTHSDDEQLFFLGLMPTYVARGANVQVVYFANHNDNPKRLHEQLHGLYAVGIRNYPIFGLIPDAYSENLKDALKNMNKANISEEMALKFQVENIRRFKPQVVVGHDEKGEYSHGQHILNTYLLEKAILNANDENYDNESYIKYGKWQISKLYLHLYEKNQIKMDYDVPLEYFNGKTAYEVSKEGYSKHLSQQWTWFTKWINGPNNSFKKATEIKKYSPLEYGLYYSNVGEDINKNDMFENITYYKDQKEEKESKNEENDNEDIGEKEAPIIQKNKKKSNKKYVIIIIVIIMIFLRLKVIKAEKNKKKKRAYKAKH